MRRLAAPFILVISVLLLACHSAFWLALFYPVAVLRLLIPIRPFRRFCARVLVQIGWGWVWCCRWVLDGVLPTRFVILGEESLDPPLDPKQSYFISSNHQSFADPLILATRLAGNVPFFRFFAKKGLIWLPFFGFAFWALDFPFMQRFSREHLERNPEDRGKDREVARKVGEKFRDIPTSIVNYAEGTRNTPAKHRSQGSPYEHLLKPKTGGIAYILSAMGQRLHRFLDVTIVYPPGPLSFWHFLAGQMPWVVMDVRQREIPPEFIEGDYMTQPDFRERIQKWTRDVWDDKDRRIEEILQMAPDFGSGTRS